MSELAEIKGRKEMLSCFCFALGTKQATRDLGKNITHPVLKTLALSFFLILRLARKEDRTKS